MSMRCDHNSKVAANSLHYNLPQSTNFSTSPQLTSSEILTKQKKNLPQITNFSTSPKLTITAYNYLFQSPAFSSLSKTSTSENSQEKLQPEVSKKNPTAMDNPPNDTNYVFQFGLKPVRILTQAIEALCDNDFNPTKRGRIVVKSTDTQRHFSITAHSASNVFGVLVLDGPELENFKCWTPILGNKFVDLNHIRENLVGHQQDEDSVTIFQTQGFDHITFIFGKDPAQQFTAELYENNDQTPGGKVQAAPKLKVLCGAAIPSRDMHLLTSQMLRNGIQRVTIGITKDEISILIGNGPIMTYNNENMYPIFTSGVMYPWQRHKATFSWTYPETLLRAARLCPYYSVHFVTAPAIRVFFQFTLPQLGKLRFMKEATRIITIDQLQGVHGHLV